MRLNDYYRGLFTRRHNGGCCGISHIHNFPGYTNFTDEKRVALINKAVENAVKANKRLFHFIWKSKPFPEKPHHAIEVVLIPDQLPKWRAALEAVGFKEVFSFLNTNSGNRCHIFYLETNA